MQQLHHTTDLLERLKTSFSAMSEGQRLLARYLVDNVESAAFLTAARLGAQVGVSESTVVRFAMMLGYQGWPELQRALADIVKARLSTVARLRMSSEVEVAGTCTDILAQDIDNIRLTMAEMDQSTFSQVVTAMSAAREIFVIGHRSAHSLALFLAFCLEMIGKRVTLITQGPRSVFEQLTRAGSGDLVFAASFPRYSRITVECFEYARGLGATTVALTDSAVSPLAQVADLTLMAKTSIDSFIESFAAPLSVINALVTAVAKKDETAALAQLEKFEDLCARHNVYWSKERSQVL